MERNPKRRSTGSQSSNPSSLRHCSYPSPTSSSPPNTSSLQPGRKLKHRSAPPKPLALTRIKGTITMDPPSHLSSRPKSSEISWLNDASPMSATPRTATPRTPQRSRSGRHSNNPTNAAMSSVGGQTPTDKRLSGTPEPVPPLVNPSSALLQDLLNEQRATRSSKSAASEDMKPSAPRTPERSHSRSQSGSQSPAQSQSRSQSQEEAASEKQRKIQTALSSGQRQPHEMGMREMGEYVSKLNKQNFDLKLEIFHRVQQMGAMEKKLHRMDKMEEEVRRLHRLEEELQELRDAESDNQRLRESNEQLRQEIDRRDHAITEAVDMICFLENKLTRPQLGADSRPSTARSYDDSPGATTPTQATTVDIPERTSSKRAMLSRHRRISPDSRFLKQTPSFLSDVTKGATALRSLYVPADTQSHSAMSEITKSESLQSMTDTMDPPSPRLSALSECSELFPPHDGENGLDQVDISVKKRDSTDSDGTEEARQSHIDHWVQPQRDIFLGDVPGQEMGPTNLFKQADKSSFESGSGNGSSQKTRLESVFGSSGLPPTPDTMSTAYAGPNRSNGSIVAEKSFVDRALAMSYPLRRPRSADELTAKRSSGNSEVVDSVVANVGDVPPSGTSLDGDESPTFFPLNSITSRDGHLYSHTPVDISRYSSYGRNELLNGQGLERVLSKLDNSYYGSMARRESLQESASSLSSSPPLTPQDWIEAAKPHPNGRKQSSDLLQIPNKAASSRLGARTPSQSSFLGRRHSIDSNIRDSDVPMIPTLDLRSLDQGLQTEESDDRRMIGRKISLRPPFFARSAPPRRLQPSLLPEGMDIADGAPAPVIHKARNPAHPKLTKKSHAVDDGPGPTTSTDTVTQRSIPHSFTESGFLNNTANSNNSNNSNTRPNSKDNDKHKRRSSLGIFGWMKGASGLGKKTDGDHHHNPPAKSAAAPPPLVSAMRKTSEFSTTFPEATRTFDVGAMNIAIEDFASKKPRAEEDEPGRRPRYMDRRSRRG
ncbi:hypothetical protein BO70DRAFT_385844 [Aspergillus heteromorphus CBS 117.55]|uniref:Uncharacterized protein n=1 Tax=Aspergillus heteromorphus CBS 117.55 TaxID=1448321 RepID=A0A317WTK4_9EURO|nr:uncharacterized protein BO70DRAFT_385844 [Aspergillus heteromorphus CBS 117.55]PWY87570.1 hypothetical protein BO70DRAFT_385844 [Aspergillus heteromorphus CBS 117.55]